MSVFAMTSLAFGKVGVLPFFAVTLLTGGLILWRGQMMRIWIKIFVVVVVLVSAIINFPLLDNPALLHRDYG